MDTTPNVLSSQTAQSAVAVQTNAVSSILIVEDDTLLLKALVEKLSKENFTVIVASDGAEGLQKALEKHPDLILLDIIMPILDGITMLAKLREDEWGKQAKVIILSNLSDGEELTGNIHELAADYLIKADWKLEDLVEKINQKLAMVQN